MLLKDMPVGATGYVNVAFCQATVAEKMKMEIHEKKGARAPYRIEKTSESYATLYYKLNEDMKYGSLIPIPASKPITQQIKYDGVTNYAE